jgi:putative phosphoserine phosphatase/1-acylglycerol-3-phosphate O-acyltransferase
MELDALLADIRKGPRGPGVGAFFDFDGTLIDGYSAGALYSHRFRNFEIGPTELVRTVQATRQGTLSEDQFVELVSMGIAGWAGRPVEDLEELGERLFRQGIAGSLFHETWRLVKAHQRQGHTVAIATSATRFQVAPLARELGVADVLCTELAAEGGLLTGGISGRTLWGPGKMSAVRDFARRRKVSLPRSYAYANGDEDVPFLSAVGNPRAVNPQRALAETATAQGWPVLQFRRGPGRLDPKPAIRTAAMYGALIGSGVAGVALGVMSGNRRRGIDLATTLFAQVAGVIGDVDVRVVGERNLWAHRPAVFLINHQSSLIDLLVTSTVLRGGFTAVAKAEAADIPVIGPLLTMADFAFIDRSSSTQARAALQQALDRLQAGTSIVISPEGTRSLTPRVGRLKKGGFHLAMQAGVPIVPIVIRNAGELMWRNAKTARTGTVEVVVHEPIATVGWTKTDLDRTVERVQQLYEDTLEEWPGPRESALLEGTS